MIIAIDPGKSGGIAFGFNGKDPTLVKMPDTLGDLLAVFRDFVTTENVVYLEQVGGYAGGAGAPGSAMFNFGRNYGNLEAVAMALGFEVRTVTPQRWQKAHNLGNSKSHANKNAWKNHLKAKAQQLYPTLNGITLATADALLIYDAAKRGLI